MRGLNNATYFLYLNVSSFSQNNINWKHYIGINTQAKYRHLGALGGH